MNWTEFSIFTKEENEEAFALFLNEISNGITVEHSLEIMRKKIDDFEDKYRLDPQSYPDSDIRIKVYFDELHDADEKRQEIEAFIENATLADKERIQITEQMISEEDWENQWKEYFHSFRVSREFVIVPSWELEQYEVSDSDKLIKLDPGMAFGTGDHPTTAMCLTFIEKHVQPHHKIIDVGTGSGILSIGCHLMGARDIKATDIDDLSLKVAKENFAINDCVNDIVIEKASLLSDEKEDYDVVIANILAHVIDDMIEDSYNRLNTGGKFISSGIIIEKRDYIIERLKDVGYVIDEVLEDNGWVSILALKR